MTTDKKLPLPEDQESRLHILREVTALTTSISIGSTTRVPVGSLLTLADWVLSGEPSFHQLPSGFEQWLSSAEPVRPDTASTTGHTEQVIIHEIAEDGLPDMDELRGQVAFVYEGAIVTGQPGEYREGVGQEWVVADSVTPFGETFRFNGVTHWVEFPLSIWELTR